MATDTQRFREHVLPHLDAAYNLARWLTRDGADAEDVVQDACVRALRYGDSLRVAEARSWFLTIVRHAFYDWVRHNRPALLARDEAVPDVAADPATSDPQAIALRAADARALADAVAALPLVFREVIVLRELEEFSYKEIATIVDAPIGTVMSRLARARALLARSPHLVAVINVASGGSR